MEKQFTNMRDIARSFANAMNLLRPETENLHQMVAYLAYNIADEMDYSDVDKKDLLYASLLYDVGIVMMPEKDAGGGRYYFKDFAGPGIGIIGDVPRLKGVCEIMKIAEPDEDADEDLFGADKYKDFAEIIHLSAEKEYVWMEVLHQPEIFLNYISDANVITLDETIELARFMSRIIDFRSSYTAMHSSGVAATAVRLAEIMGMSEDECKMMMIAGYLHDIGKLKVPKTLLDKNDKLTDSEFNIVKEYAYYTNLLLKDIAGFEQIGRWASLHHEKLNGYGYPFRLSADDIPMGARIIAIADIFSAVAEIRAYRPGMSKEEVIVTLKEYVESGAMSGYLVDLLINNYDDIYSIRDREVRREGARYFASSVDVD